LLQYRHTVGPESPVWRSPASKELTDYLWSVARETLKLGGNAGTSSQERWAYNLWIHLVRPPLQYLATRTATEDITLGRPHAQWRLDADDLADAVEELIGPRDRGFNAKDVAEAIADLVRVRKQ